jgi:OmpA-OmpF porin, OOP family
MKMQKVLFMCLVLLVAIVIIPTGARAFELITTTETVTIDEVKIELKKTADNFIILCDTSLSMGKLYKATGKSKITLQKEILELRNAALPDLGFNGGLYTFNPEGEMKAATIARVLKPYYEVKPYNKAEFAKAIDQLPTVAAGPTPLQSALHELEDVLAPLKGHTVVFVVTDGSSTNWLFMQKPIDIARDLAQKYDVSFYVIDSSQNQKNPKFEYLVNSIDARSRLISFDQFVENPLFLSGALFVLDKRIVKKSIDIEKVIGIKLSDALFAFDSAEIDPKYADGLKKLGKYMQDTPKALLALSAFTDNYGPSSYNLELSRRRVESIASYLEKNYNIARTRMVLNFYGEANPVASNDTAEGRAKNRRIEGFIFGL